jgi:hypothetical protein
MVNQKEALQSLWKGVCTIIVQAEKQNPITKKTEFEPDTLCDNEPCKLSYTNLTSTNENSNAEEVKQVPKLFLSNEITVPAGSKITVTQNGKTTEFEKSGEPAVFSNHQEIILELFKGWA